MAYFACYAFWNCFTLPALLLRPDIGWTEPEPGRLEAVFPPDLPTHCRRQRFRFDRDTGLLAQHDYAPDVISRFAHAAHAVLDHARDLAYPSRRRVTPKGRKGRPMRRPVLVDITVHDFRLLAGYEKENP